MVVWLPSANDRDSRLAASAVSRSASLRVTPRAPRRCGWPTRPTGRRFGRGSCCSPSAVRAAAPRSHRLRRAGALRLSRGAARAHARMGAARGAAVRADVSRCAFGAAARPRSGWPLFRVAPATPARFAEFADARTLVTLNARPLGRDIAALQPGDLLYFRQPAQSQPDHVMVFVGRSFFDREHDDWVVYHTGPIDGGPGEVRKVRLHDLAAASGAALAAADVESAIRRRLPAGSAMSTAVASSAVGSSRIACSRSSCCARSRPRRTQDDGAEHVDPAFTLSSSEVFTTRDSRRST